MLQTSEMMGMMGHEIERDVELATVIQHYDVAKQLQKTRTIKHFFNNIIFKAFQRNYQMLPF